MQYDEFIAEVRRDGSIENRDHAERATVATLEVLGQRLAGGEPHDLAAQLPQELKATLDQHAGEAETFDVDDFFRRLADHEGSGCSPEQAREHARAVLSTLSRSVSSGEVENMRAQLPAGYAFLLQ